MHAYAPQRLLLGRGSHLVRRLCLFAGLDPRPTRRCFCVRCAAARNGLFRRTRTWVGRRAYADVQLFGIRISHRFAFEMPMTAPPVSAGTLETAERSASGKDPRLLPLTHVLSAHS